MAEDSPDPDSKVSSADDEDAIDLEAALGADDEDEEENALDLEELDRLGVDGVVERLRGGPVDKAAEDGDRAAAGVGGKPPRSPIISLIAVLASSVMLLLWYPDFRYWLRADEPEDLGDVGELVASGKLASGEFHDHYVVIRGTPDVQHAARVSNKKRETISHLVRIKEAGASLFAAETRQPDEDPNEGFEAEYRGRMIRMGTHPSFPFLQEYFGGEKLTEPVDVTKQEWVAALKNGAAGVTVPGPRGPVDVEPEHEIRIVVDTPDVRIQLGVGQFSDDEAEAAVAGLGYPWMSEGKRAKVGFMAGELAEGYYRFVARIPAAERDAAAAALKKASKDPTKGVELLPLRSIFLAKVGDVKVDGDTVAFPYGEDTTMERVVEGGKLAKRSLERGAEVEVAVADVAAFRYERPLLVDKDGYFIEAGASPSSERMVGILWLLLAGIATMNVLLILQWWRRKQLA